MAPSARVRNGSPFLVPGIEVHSLQHGDETCMKLLSDCASCVPIIAAALGGLDSCCMDPNLRGGCSILSMLVALAQHLGSPEGETRQPAEEFFTASARIDVHGMSVRIAK